MIINGKRIAATILKHLKVEIASIIREKKIKKPKLVVFSVKAQAQDNSFIKSKEKAAKLIGADFELIAYKKAPRFEEFAQKLREIAGKPEVTAVIIQQPLPPSLTTVTLFDYIPLEKDIEANKKKTPFVSPIGLSVLCILKNYFDPSSKTKAENVIVDMKRDMNFFRQLLKRKKLVLLGRGETGGRPIGDTLSLARINYINLNSKTPEPENFLRAADIIISATGRKVLDKTQIKPGAVVVGVGIRREAGEWAGDYDENEIKSVAGAYTPTPGGVGPVDVAYLMHNLVQAWKIQNES